MKVHKSQTQVGAHIPPPHIEIDAYLEHFAKAYDPTRLSSLRLVMALGACHHRFAWIHPFYDGNGRVARLMSHAQLRAIGLGSVLWSVARGLARTVEKYKDLLAAADNVRWNDYDGRGVLSEKALVRFCEYFLDTAIDQVKFMANLLDAPRFLDRLEAWCARQAATKQLEANSFPLLREAWLRGRVPRARLATLCNVKERQARQIASRLSAAHVLVADSPRADFKLNFPITVVEEWFPGLYPPFDKLPETSFGVYPGMVIM